MTSEAEEITAAETRPIPTTFNLTPDNYDFIRQWAADERRTYSAQLNVILDSIRETNGKADE